MKNKILFKIIIAMVVIVVLLVPIFIFINNDSKNKNYNNLLSDIEQAAKTYFKEYDLEGNVKVKLGTLKEYSLIDSDIVNPKTDRPVSNETYVVKEKDEYSVFLYDIPKNESTKGLIITFNGDKSTQNGIAVRYSELGINVYDGSESLDYSTQYFVKNKEVQSIDTSKPKNYEVVYTVLTSKGEVAKVVRTVVVQ